MGRPDQGSAAAEGARYRLRVRLGLDEHEGEGSEIPVFVFTLLFGSRHDAGTPTASGMWGAAFSAIAFGSTIK